jgi:signal transduction histidine kinase
MEELSKIETPKKLSDGIFNTFGLTQIISSISIFIFSLIFELSIGHNSQTLPRLGILALILATGNFLAYKFFKNKTQNLFEKRLSYLITSLYNQRILHTKNQLNLNPKVKNWDEIDQVIHDINMIFEQYNKMIVDISEYSTASQTLTEEDIENNALEIVRLKHELSKSKTLLRIVFHDIANPLTVIRNSIKLTNRFIESDHQGNEKKIIKKIQAIGKATINIVDILNQIKELEAIKSGKIKVKLGPVDLEEVIENARFTFESKFENKNINFIFKNYLDGENILAEKVSLSNNVVNNIISNAIKFCDIDGHIEVSAKRINNMILLTMTDDGIGIPDSILTKLFDDEAKTSRPGTGGEPGTGFGMPIVKSYMDLYEGNIEVLSKVKDNDQNDSGTTFNLLFKISG